MEIKAREAVWREEEEGKGGGSVVYRRARTPCTRSPVDPTGSSGPGEVGHFSRCFHPQLALLVDHSAIVRCLKEQCTHGRLVFSADLSQKLENLDQNREVSRRTEDAAIMR